MTMPFFINPKRRRKAARRRGRKRLFGAAAKAKRGILMGAAAKAARRRSPKRKRRASTAKRRRRATGSMQSIRRKGSKQPVSRAAWLASGFRRNIVARRRKVRRRRVRRNPPRLFGRGMMGQAFNTLLGGAGVTAGKIVARQGSALIKVDPSTPVGLAVQLGIALAAGIGARTFLRLKGPFVDGLVYGAASGAAESLIKMVAPTAAAQLLGEYEYAVPLAAYPTAALPPASPAMAAMGAYATSMY